MIDYPMPGQAPDLFKGFREELGNIRQERDAREKRAMDMASKITMADQSTMFGGDYSEAQQMAQWLTEHIDDYADSTEGMIEFQQMTQQLNNFIDASEAYKTQNFGNPADGASPGTFNGAIQRTLGGINSYEKDGFMDTRTKSDYEMTYMGLNQERSLQFDEQGRPKLSNQGRMENPFMPKLEEVPFEGGFEWFEENAKGHKFPDGWSDAKVWLEQKAQDPKLRMRIARAHARKTGNTGDINELMQQDSFMKGAMDTFMTGAQDSFNAHSGTPKPETPKTFMEMEADIVTGYSSDVDIPLGDAVVIDRVMPGGEVKQEVNQDTLGFDTVSILKKPLSSASYPSLGEGSRVIGFNVDRNGQIWVLKDVLYTEELTGADGSKTEVEKKRREFVKADDDLRRTIELHVPPALIKEYWERSLRNSNTDRERRLNERFENAQDAATEVGSAAIDAPIGPSNETEWPQRPTTQPDVQPQAFYGPTLEQGGLINRFRNFFRT